MPQGAPYDAREVSNYIIKLATNSGVRLTQMSLLKIVFYAHGWYLATAGVPLFKQPVEAWEFGPVVKVVRDAFKDFGKRPIDRFAERLDLHTGELIPVSDQLSEEDEKFVSSVFSQYCGKSAFELSDMSHEKGSPWDRVWNSKVAVGRLGLRIRNEEIREYFLLMKARGTLH
jgi:uncharacterized phage-associated protein